MKGFVILYNKLTYTMLITFHQSSMLNLSLACALQIENLDSDSILNIFGFMIAILSLIYLVAFLFYLARKLNGENLPLIIGI